MAEYTCCSSVVFERPNENTFTFTSPCVASASAPPPPPPRCPPQILEQLGTGEDAASQPPYIVAVDTAKSTLAEVAAAVSTGLGPGGVRFVHPSASPATPSTPYLQVWRSAQGTLGDGSGAGGSLVGGRWRALVPPDLTLSPRPFQPVVPIVGNERAAPLTPGLPDVFFCCVSWCWGHSTHAHPAPPPIHPPAPRPPPLPHPLHTVITPHYCHA
jgi:hypothetical protein